MDEVQTPARLASRAAEVIESRGWAQGVLIDHDGGVCVRGAMFTVLHGDPQEWPSESDDPSYSLWRETESYILDVVPMPYDDVADWNNDPNTTKEEVLRVLHLVEQQVAA